MVLLTSFYRQFCVRWLAMLCASLLLLSAAAADVPTALGARVSGDQTRTRFVADLNQPVSYSVYVLPDPFRVIIDLPDMKFDLPPGIGRKVRGLIEEYRYGALEDGKSRFVIDTKGPVLIEKSYIVKPQGSQPARIVVDLVKTDRKAFMKTYKSEIETAAIDPIPEDLPAAAQPQSEAAEVVPLPMPKPGTEAPAAPKEKPAAKPRNGRRVVVIDPGHGGIDPGAIGRNKTREKDVVLAFGLALRDQLEKSKKYTVIMTREDDKFLTLKDRVRVARRNEADLFIAIHADTVRGASARGATLYTVSDKASDAEAEALAQKENRADIIGGVDLGTENEEVTDILIDLAQRETKNHAVFFAKKAVSELKPVTQMTGQPMRSAGFVVLKAPDVPSVLLELGYLSSKADEELLTSVKWRSKIAVALGQAIDRYFATEIAQRQ